jgi:TolB-like protein
MSLEPLVMVAVEGAAVPVGAQCARARVAAEEIVTLARTHGGEARQDGPRTVVEFRQSLDALRFALALRDGAGAGMKVGIHRGVEIRSQAEAVAAAVGHAAPAGGIGLSQRVRQDLPPETELPFEPMGPLRIQGIPAPVEAFRLDGAAGRCAVGWEPRILRFGAYEIDAARFELRRDGARVPLEPRAFDLLLLLARNRQRTVTKDEIFGALWGDRIVSDAALSSQVKAVRQAVGDDGVAQHTIATVHGRGFRFVPPLDRLATGPPAAQPQAGLRRSTVAVLPFVPIGPEAALLADGITEDVLTALAKNRWLGVVARSSCFAFRTPDEPITAIGEKLRADYIVTGSVRREASRVRTNVEIVDARTADALWSERLDREERSVFDLQDAIASTVASRIAIELGIVEQRKSARRPGATRDAWDLYHLGSAEFYRFTPEGNRRCQTLLREAIRQAPAFAEPHARLAYAIVLSMVYFERRVDQGVMDEALALALRGIALDDQDAHGYFALGRVRLARCEYGLAIDALEQALALNPCLALSYCGLGDSLAYEDRLDEAIAQFRRAIELSPHDPFRWAFFSYRALAHLFGREFEEAAAWARRAAQVPNAHYSALAHLVAALGHLGDEAQTDAARAALLRARPGFSRAFACERLFYVRRRHHTQTYLEGLTRAGIA